MTTPLARLADLGIVLPEVVPPLAAYVPARRSGATVYVSGQLPLVDGSPIANGKVGAQVAPEVAASCARACALNGLAAAHALVGLDAVVGVVKLVGFVAADPSFTGHPAVVDGASELIGQVFGDGHARSAVGVASLPLDVPVEVELILELAG